MKNLGIIGFGNMGSAFSRGLKNSGIEPAVTDAKLEKLKNAEEKYNIKTFKTNRELVSFADTVILAVKPQELNRLSEEAGGLFKGKKIISIIAGKSIKSLLDLFNADTAARFMPNLAAGYRKALVGVSFSGNADGKFKTDCIKIAEAVGYPCEIDENLMPAVTGLSGSGIAYVFSFIHALALGGVKSGINYTKSLEIATAAVEGAVEVLNKSGGNPMEWLSRVISPAGTTIAGVEQLEKNGFTYGIIKAVEAAAERASELEK
jgi:pyrroline-5-carboxylate reductase